MSDCIGTGCKREGLQKQNAILNERIRVLREALEYIAHSASRTDCVRKARAALDSTK